MSAMPRSDEQTHAVGDGKDDGVFVESHREKQATIRG